MKAEAASKDNVAEEARELRALRVIMANQAAEYAGRAGYDLKNAERQAKWWRNLGTNEEMVKAWDDKAQNMRVEAKTEQRKARVAKRRARLTVEGARATVIKAAAKRAEATAARKAKEDEEAARWRSDVHANPLEMMLRAEAVALRNSEYSDN
jgi:hypothetical protein